MFLLFFYVRFLVFYVLLSILDVLCFCTVLRFVFPQVYSCLFSICVRVYCQDKRVQCCHHGMARPQVPDGGTASRYGG
jgi:hypothetical protein